MRLGAVDAGEVEEVVRGRGGIREVEGGVRAGRAVDLAGVDGTRLDFG